MPDGLQVKFIYLILNNILIITFLILNHLFYSCCLLILLLLLPGNDSLGMQEQQYMHGEVKVADSHPVEDCLKPTQPCIELLTSLGTSKSDKYKQLSSMTTYLSIEGPLVVRPPLLVFINHYQVWSSTI